MVGSSNGWLTLPEGVTAIQIHEAVNCFVAFVIDGRMRGRILDCVDIPSGEILYAIGDPDSSLDGRHAYIFWWNYGHGCAFISDGKYSVLKRLGFVYLIHAKGTSLFKIGVSSDPEKRLNQLNSGQSPHPLEIIAVSPIIGYPEKCESFLHDVMKEKRVHGEWFNLSIDNVKCISQFLKDNSVDSRYYSHSLLTSGSNFADTTKRMDVKKRLNECKETINQLHLLTKPSNVRHENSFKQAINTDEFADLIPA